MDDHESSPNLSKNISVKMMLMNYFYASREEATEEGPAVAESSGPPGCDGDLVPGSHPTAPNDPAGDLTAKIRLQACSVVVDGNPNKASARDLVETPTAGHFQSSNVASPPIVKEDSGDIMLPVPQHPLETKSKRNFTDIRMEIKLVNTHPKDNSQAPTALVSDFTKEDAEVFQLWAQMRDAILVEEHSAAGPSSAVASASLTAFPSSSSDAPTATSPTTSAGPRTPTDTSAVDFVQPSPLRACFSSPLISTSPGRGRFVELFDTEGVSVVPWGENNDIIQKRHRKRTMSGLLHRWRPRPKEAFIKQPPLPSVD